MVNALQDRPVSASLPSVPPPRGRRSRPAVVVAGAAALGLLVVAGVDRALDLVPSFDNPLQEKVIDHRSPALMLALDDLAEYHAAKGRFQVVVDLEKDTPYVPGIVKGERTTYLANGSVDGVVDLRGLEVGSVTTEGEAVVITLPRPRLGEPVLDLESSKVVARDRGVLDRIGGVLSDSPTSERDVALLAEDKLVDAAAESDLLRRAEDNTRSMLTGLARSFGYSDVTVRFDADAGT